MILLRVIGIPKPQARPRVFQVGGRVMAHSPKTSWFQAVYGRALESRPSEAYDAPLAANIEFIMPRPKSRKGAIWAAVRPDLDNLSKSIFDALTQARWWTDDCRVVKSSQSKRYANDGEEPGVIVSVSVA